MRFLMLSLVLTMAVLVPNIGNAQVNMVGTRPPTVTAAGAEWQASGEPVIYNGDVYYPAGPRVFFDGNVMAQIGTFRGVPIYADATLEPNSIVYVPVSSGQLRPYERRRARDLAGPVGTVGTFVSTPVSRPVGTAGTFVTRPLPTHMESIPRPLSNAGIWIEFNGSRWYHAGTAVLYSPERFVPAGEYHGFPVFVGSDGKTDRIYVTAVLDGPLVPYKK